LLAAVLPSVLQWMAIQLGLRGVWPAIEGEDPADNKVESFLTHARRSVMRDRNDKKDRKKKDSYHSCGSLVELGTLEAIRKDPTGCDLVIQIQEADYEADYDAEEGQGRSSRGNRGSSTGRRGSLGSMYTYPPKK
jgi:hypothetical protein